MLGAADARSIVLEIVEKVRKLYEEIQGMSLPPSPEWERVTL
jgi:hypothetical protein